MQIVSIILEFLAFILVREDNMVECEEIIVAENVLEKEL